MTDRELLKKWVDTWKWAGPELEAIWRHEVANLDTRKVIAYIYGDEPFTFYVPPRTTSPT